MFIGSSTTANNIPVDQGKERVEQAVNKVNNLLFEMGSHLVTYQAYSQKKYFIIQINKGKPTGDQKYKLIECQSLFDQFYQFIVSKFTNFRSKHVQTVFGKTGMAEFSKDITQEAQLVNQILGEISQQTDKASETSPKEKKQFSDKKSTIGVKIGQVKLGYGLVEGENLPNRKFSTMLQEGPKLEKQINALDANWKKIDDNLNVFLKEKEKTTTSLQNRIKDLKIAYPWASNHSSSLKTLAHSLYNELNEFKKIHDEIESSRNLSDEEKNALKISLVNKQNELINAAPFNLSSILPPFIEEIPSFNKEQSDNNLEKLNGFVDVLHEIENLIETISNQRIENLGDLASPLSLLKTYHNDIKTALTKRSEILATVERERLQRIQQEKNEQAKKRKLEREKARKEQFGELFKNPLDTLRSTSKKIMNSFQIGIESEKTKTEVNNSEQSSIEKFAQKTFTTMEGVAEGALTYLKGYKIVQSFVPSLQNDTSKKEKRISIEIDPTKVRRIEMDPEKTKIEEQEEIYSEADRLLKELFHTRLDYSFGNLSSYEKMQTAVGILETEINALEREAHLIHTSGSPEDLLTREQLRKFSFTVNRFKAHLEYVSSNLSKNINDLSREEVEKLSESIKHLFIKEKTKNLRKLSNNFKKSAKESQIQIAKTFKTRLAEIELSRERIENAYGEIIKNPVFKEVIENKFPALKIKPPESIAEIRNIINALEKEADKTDKEISKLMQSLKKTKNGLDYIYEKQDVLSMNMRKKYKALIVNNSHFSDIVKKKFPDFNLNSKTEPNKIIQIIEVLASDKSMISAGIRLGTHWSDVTDAIYEYNVKQTLIPYKKRRDDLSGLIKQLITIH